MKIGVFGIKGWEEEALKQAFPEDEILISKDNIDDDCMPEQKDFEIICIFVDSKITRNVLDQFPNLKMVVTRSTGFDHIDLAAAKEKGVLASYVPGYGDNTVAEFAFGLLLSLARKIYDSIDRIKETGNFDFHDLRGFDVKGKTIGIIGTGRIGREMIRISKGFSLNIVAYDPFPNYDFQKEIGFEYAGLEDLLRKSDFVSLHCPYNEHTHHIINKDNIGMMKKGAMLINTARGALVETEALVNALENGQLGGAGLDVLEEEGEIKDELHFLISGHPKAEDMKVMLLDHALMRMPNVLVTPHNAFNSQEALHRILDTSIENIKKFKEGNPQNLVPEK